MSHSLLWRHIDLLTVGVYASNHRVVYTIRISMTTRHLDTHTHRNTHTHTAVYWRFVCWWHTYTHSYPCLIALHSKYFSITFTWAFPLHACGVTRNWHTYFTSMRRIFLVETVVLQTVLWDIRAWSARFLVLFVFNCNIYLGLCRITDHWCSSLVLKLIVLFHLAARQRLSEQDIMNRSCGRVEIMGSIVADSAPYLYPFIVEYSLIAACVLFIMWKHIGRSPKWVVL